MPTEADEIRGAFNDLAGGPVDAGQLLSSVRSTARRRRAVQAGSALSVAAVAAVAVASSGGSPDRIRTIPARPSEMSFCTARESVVRRDFATIVDDVPFDLRLPDPLPEGACLSNVDYALGFREPPIILSVNLWFDWDGARISIRQEQRTEAGEELGDPVDIAGRPWHRLATTPSSLPGSNSRGGTVYFQHRFDDGVVVTVSTVTGAEQAARTFVELLDTSDREASTAARELCEAALPGRQLVSATAATVGEIREHRVGPGLSPAANSFVGHSDSSTGAWCWVVRPADSSLPDGGTTAYGVGPGAATGEPEVVEFAVIGRGATGGQTSGAPIVP